MLLLRSAYLFRHGGVYSLQSVGEAQSESASYRTEKGDTRTRPDGRKRTDLHQSGNVQPNAGTADGMCISSPSDIRVIKINTRYFQFLCFPKRMLMQCDVKENMDFRTHKKHNVLQKNFQYFLTYYCLFVHSFSFSSI